MPRRICHLLVFLLLLLADRGQAAVEIPFALRDGLIWLQVSTAGRAEPLHFLLDSGAGVSVLDLHTARRLGQKLDAPQTVRGIGGRSLAFRVAGPEMHLAGVALPPPRLALDLRAVSAGCGRRIDGLIGADFFRDRIVQVDFRAQKIRLLVRAELPTAACATLPLLSRGNALCVRLSVNDQPPAWVRVDTGCDTALEWVARAPRQKALSGPSIAAGPGSRPQQPTTVQLGALRLEGIPTGLRPAPIFAGEAGLLGNGLLARFTVTFDAPKKRLLLTRN